MTHDTDCKRDYDEVKNDADYKDIIYEDIDNNNVKEMTEGNEKTCLKDMGCYVANDGFCKWMRKMQHCTLFETRNFKEKSLS